MTIEFIFIAKRFNNNKLLFNYFAVFFEQLELVILSNISEILKFL